MAEGKHEAWQWIAPAWLLLMGGAAAAVAGWPWLQGACNAAGITILVIACDRRWGRRP